MSRILSNGPNEDYVDGPFEQMLKGADRASLAAPYFTHSKSLVEAATSGTKIRLLVGLNLSTSPTALREAFNQEGIEIRYRKYFHAKIYIFDDDDKALLGSANLSNNGLRAKREAVIRLDRNADKEAVKETRAVFDDLWRHGKCLTESTLETFAKKRDDQLERRRREDLFDLDGSIDAAVNHADWLENTHPNLVKPNKRIREEIRLHKCYCEYIYAFDEVRSIVEAPRFRNPHMSKFPIVFETERFLNFIHNYKVLRKEAKRTASHALSQDERQEKIIYFAEKWANSNAPLHPLPSKEYSNAIMTVTQIFSTPNKIRNTSENDIFDAIKRLHAFNFHIGHVKDAQRIFIEENRNSLSFIQDRLIHLLHGPGDFIARIYDVSNRDEPDSLSHIGNCSAFELYGTVHHNKCPPINNRTVGVLNLLNFDVSRV